MKKAAAGLLISFLSLPAVAANSGVYLVGGLGVGYLPDSKDVVTTIDQGAVAFGYASSQSKYSRASALAKLGLGYRISKHFAIEADYLTFGTARFDTITSGPVTNGLLTIENDVANLSLIASVPVSANGQVLLKVGQAWVDTTVAISRGMWIDQRRSYSQSDLSYGLGFQQSLSDKLELSLEWDKFTTDETFISEELDLHALSLNLKYHF